MDKEEKHLLIFSAKWCGPCRMMKSMVWNDPSVKQSMEDFDSVTFLDIDDPEHREMAIAYRVQAVLTIYIVDKEGIPKKAASTMDVRGTLSFLG